MITDSEARKFNAMSVSVATLAAEHAFGGKVVASKRKGMHQIQRWDGLSIETLGSGPTWVEAFRAAARTLGLVG